MFRVFRGSKNFRHFFYLPLYGKIKKVSTYSREVCRLNIVARIFVSLSRFFFAYQVRVECAGCVEFLLFGFQIWYLFEDLLTVRTATTLNAVSLYWVEIPSKLWSHGGILQNLLGHQLRVSLFGTRNSVKLKSQIYWKYRLFIYLRLQFRTFLWRIPLTNF